MKASLRDPQQHNQTLIVRPRVHCTHIVDQPVFGGPVAPIEPVLRSVMGIGSDEPGFCHRVFVRTNGASHEENAQLGSLVNIVSSAPSS